MTTPDGKKRLSIEPVHSAAPEIGILLGMLEDTRQRTLAVVQELTQTELDLPLAGGKNTTGALLYHIAAVELSWLYEEVLAEDFPPDLEALFQLNVRDESGQLSQIEGLHLADYLERLSAVRSALLDTYTKMSIETFRNPHSYPEYEVTPEWVLHHLMQHEAEHRGQISPDG